MACSISASKTNPPLGALFTAKALEGVLPVSVVWGGGETLFTAPGEAALPLESPGISRCLGRLSPISALYPSAALARTEVDHWLTFSLSLSCPSEMSPSLSYLASVLDGNSYLVGDCPSLGDYEVLGSLLSSPAFLWLQESKAVPPSVARWLAMMSSRQEVSAVLKELPQEARAKPAKPQEGKDKVKAEKGEKKEEKGTFIELPGAEMGKVVVRFPPEASGYLHVGHAKAALLNNHYKEAFKGKLIMRFDDTNPAKEKEEYEEVILEDLKLLQVSYDHFSRTSDHFEIILKYCEKLLREGKAYVDDTDAVTMKEEREAKIKSKNWNNPVEKNLKLWEEMKKGSEEGVKCAVRAKIDMESMNGCMRDPTIYRCKPEPHPATGTKYKVYPTYDFACPIVDSVEGVTHALRTTEYMDRDDQFNWFITALGLRRPHIWAYARLNLTNTVMSKRKLTWLVDEAVVDGWDDPRLPTVRGILRRGLTVEALRQFIAAQGSSRSVVFMEWDKIWAFNKKVLDPVVPRHTTVEKTYNVPVKVAGAKLEKHNSPKHPKNPDVGEKEVWTGPELIIDGADAEQLKEGENATFINWGNMMIKKVNKSGSKVESVDVEDNTSNKDFKKTLKLTWLCNNEDKSPKTPTVLIYYDHIISKPILDKDDEFKDFVGKDTRFEVEMLGDPELMNLKKGEIIQIQRRGYFICDSPYAGYSVCVGRAKPVVLIAIPDGTAGSYGPPGKPVVKAEAPTKGAAKGGKTEKKGAKETPKKLVSAPSTNSNSLDGDITRQGDLVRKLKAEKAAKPEIDEAVKKLLALKAEFKAATGSDWKPGAAPVPAASSSSSNAGDLNTSVAAQGDLVRKLKAEKAAKPDIDEAVKKLLALKAEFKAATGNDWKPGAAPAPSPARSNASTSDDLNSSIADQGDTVRKLKADKAPKPDIDEAVKTLLALKADYKAATGQDWKPGAQPKASKVASPPPSGNVAEVDASIRKQGDLVRKLKSEKANKQDIDAAVKELLALKSKFKEATGNDWKPDQPAPVKQEVKGDSVGDGISAKITAQGDIVRKLKSEKKPKEEIDAAVKTLLELKGEYKAATGNDWQPAGGGAKKADKPKEKKEAKPKEKASAPAAGVTRLGLEVKKEENLPDWYSQVLTKAEMMEYYDVSGCYILRPWSFSIWESIKDFFDAEIKKIGVTNCYFPCFVSHAALEREKTHIEDFAPEVAWVTKSGDSELAEPIAIRPTSETVMYPAYAKWIQSYRDLPLKLNQWNNVVRWEFKHPQPFLRTREFLWQEGHTAFATFPEAKEEVLVILDLYRRVYEELLAIPVIRGKKTEKEKFAGGDYTTTVEAYISAAGRAIQGATSHHLGQNFSKMFDITFENPETGEKQFVFQNSWGITTRTIGVLVMVHADNNGLVLPPKIACLQVVIVPCGVTVNLKEADRKALEDECKAYEEALRGAGVRVKADMRDNYSPGWKFNHWELKGVPVRVEVGPRDMKNSQYVAVRRDTGEKLTMSKSGLIKELPALLETIQSDLFSKAKSEMDSHVKVVHDFPAFLAGLDAKCLLLAPFCGAEECEDEIKELSKKDADLEPGAPSMGAKSLCIPFSQPQQLPEGQLCLKPGCTCQAKFYTLFGRSY